MQLLSNTSNGLDGLNSHYDNVLISNLYNILTFHSQKFNVLRSLGSGNYSIDDGRISTLATVDGLEFILNHLFFESHINEKVNKANSLAGIIPRSFVYLGKEIFLSLFLSIVRLQIEYETTFWKLFRKNLINIIEYVQHRALKQLPEVFGLTYREILKVHDLLAVQYRRYCGDRRYN